MHTTPHSHRSCRPALMAAGARVAAEIGACTADDLRRLGYAPGLIAATAPRPADVPSLDDEAIAFGCVVASINRR